MLKSMTVLWGRMSAVTVARCSSNIASERSTLISLWAIINKDESQSHDKMTSM